MANRRSFLQSAVGIAAGLFTTDKLLAENQNHSTGSRTKRGTGNSTAHFDVPVVTTDIGDLPFTMDGDVKVFHLIAQVIT